MIRLGVVGLGIMGEQYVRIFQGHPGATIAAVTSRRPERVDAIAEQYGVQTRSPDLDALLAADIDAVCVATPDHAHYAVVRSALDAGKHVLCEKPFTTDLAEADDLVERSRARPDLVVQVAFNHRWLPSYHQGRVAIERGDVGTPVAGYARKNDTIFVPTEMLPWAASTTPIQFLGAHDIDLMRWYFGQEPVEAYATGASGVLKARGVDTYDIIQAQVRFDGGAFATFEAGWIYPNTFPTLTDSFVEVVGTAGHIHFDRKRESIEISTAARFTYPKTFLLSEVFGRTRGAFVECLSDFLVAIEARRPARVTAIDGRQVTAVLDAVARSLASARPERVHPLPPART